ncbi:MAG: transglycosylase SLT domain-containing protein [Bacteroidales bacterium]
MKRGNYIFILFISVFVFFPLLTTCHRTEKEQVVHNFDYEQIRKRGRLIAITDFNSMNYFIYKGQPLGYQYELLQEFSNHIGLPIQVIVQNDIHEAIHMLNTGEADLIAMNLTVTNERMKVVSFSVPITSTRQVLVQRKPGVSGNSGMVPATLEFVKTPADLAQKLIYVQKGSSYADRLRNLSEETGAGIRIKEVPATSEDLVEQVAKGEIDFTVCDENIARVAAMYYPNIDYSVAVSLEQNLAWAARKDSPELLGILNTWLGSFTSTTRFSNIYRKYFDNARTSSIVNNEYFVLRTGRISQYDELIQKYSVQINWDWTLLASLIYQESHFNPHARSWAGAYGLMQLMPSVLDQFGIDTLASPEKNIEAGIKLIAYLDQQFDPSIPKDERVKFILAAYNIGLGHVWDAQRLAEKYGQDPNKWDNVEYFLIQKKYPRYYLDPVVKNGFCKGELAVQYVKDVLHLYHHYSNIIASLEK